VAQQVVGQHEAIIASPTGTARMPTQGSWRPLVTMSVSSPARSPCAAGEDRRGRLDGEAHHDRLAGRDAAEDAAGVVGQERRRAVVAMRISSAFSSPVSAAAAKPAPISTPLTALMLIIAAARSASSLP
jgi:hypothetical protein